MASFSTSSIRKNFKYHVFISFRGEDTRTTFVDHLYHSLKRLGIHTFRDNEELQKGKRIDELFKAIEESKFFIIVFSQNYASSSWCLKELAKIMECEDSIERIAYPLFHDVDPAHIRKQSGPVEAAIAKHKSDKQIKTWKKALQDAGNLVGWDLKKIANGHEAEAIEQIVKEISVKLRLVYSSKDETLVGMESRMQALESSLGNGLDDEVRMIGIKGMGGIGKTTLVRAIYQEISSQFEGKSFVENVREASKARGGLLSLQQQVLRDVFNDDSVNSAPDAISTMKMKMPLKKVLLVLDDVNHRDQLEALAGDWFKDGSRIIITTRDAQVLIAHGITRIHDVSFLSDEEAFRLFSRYAFKSHTPDEGYEKLSSQVVHYAAGLPLTITVLGASLFRKKAPVWIDVLKRLEKIPCEETLKILEISYNSLEKDQQEIFLDVACFMKWMRKEDAIRMLESRGFNAIIGLTVLEERSLITISYQHLNMHDSIEELGRDIVRRSHPRESNKHSRLWVPKEIEALLSDDEITEAAATCIRLKSADPSPEIILKSLGKLKNLSVVHISGRHDDCRRDNRMFDQVNFPNALQFLKWERYPGPCLPRTFLANNQLVGLELPRSIIMQLWKSGEQKVLSNLRFLNLSESKLTTLDLGMTPNLERLDLQGCHDLTEIHVSAGCLKKLIYLNLLGCSRFGSSSFIQQVKSLELLSLPKLRVSVMSFPKLRFRCFYREEQDSLLENNQKSVIIDLQPGTKLESVCGSFFGLQHLRHLRFEGCITELPNDLDRLANLEELNLESTHIKCLPDTICMLKHLKSLKLISCLVLQELPSDLGQLECLEKLILIECKSLKDIPNNICNMKCLRYLFLPLCKQVENLPEELGSLECLKVLDIRDTGISHLPHSFSSLEGLRVIGSRAVLQSCLFATEIHTPRLFDTYPYMQAVNNTEAVVRLENQFTENNSNRHEAEAIDQIVKEISLKLYSIFLSKKEKLVGMESRMQDLESSLGIGLDNDVRMIGIKGMGGIGKTTLARAIFHEISSQFEGISFVENVREASKARGLLSLQQQVLRDVLKDDSMNNVQDAIFMMKIIMPLKKVLLVLDDVDDAKQLEALAGDWFADGSRIIITTRDEQVLRAHRVNRIHAINLLSDEEAINLFNKYAFDRYIPIQGYEDLSLKVVKYAVGLPVTLIVLGSLLIHKEMIEWRDTLERLKEIPERITRDKLEISYNDLEEDHKEIFLDVACFMKGLRREEAIRILESRGFHAIIGLRVLEERSLITFSNQLLEMHDSIQVLGMDIVRKSHPYKPNKHSRLWVPKEIETILSDDEVTTATATFIKLESADLRPEIIMKGLAKLKKLRVLHISRRDNGFPRNKWMFVQDSFPNSLQFLKWECYPGLSLPQTFQADNLVGLELPGSRIMQLWESGEQKVLLKLRFLNLSNSKLRALHLGMTPNLERLDLQGCHDLTRLDVQTGCLKRLVYLNLIGCSRLRSFSFIKRLESLECLSLTKLEVIVKSASRNACDNLPELSFTCNYLEEQAENSQKSVSLDLEPYTKLESVCGSFFGLQHIRYLTFDRCIPELPKDLDQLENLEELILDSTKIECLPDSICMMKNLKSLKLISCLFLQELPRDLGQLECLEKLILRKCASLKDIPNSIYNMKRLKELDITDTGIRHLPQSIASLEGLLVVGSEEVFQSCVFATEIQTSEAETFCYIQAVGNTEAKTGLENNSNRWRWSVVVPVAVMLLRHVMQRAGPRVGRSGPRHRAATNNGASDCN